MKALSFVVFILVMAEQCWQWLSRKGNMFGCRICHTMHGRSTIESQDRFAHFKVQKLKLSNVKRHMKSKMHQKYVASMSSGSNPNAPTPEQFEKVWMNRKGCASLAAPVDGLTLGDYEHHRPSAKVRCMIWCIAEAKRVEFRSFLRTAVSATLTQDVRQEMLLVRMTACDAALNQRSGMVGLVRTMGGATNLCLATMTAIEQLCSPFVHQPNITAVSKSELDTALMKHVCSIVTWWYTDAAAEELSAGEIFMSSTAARTLFPNLKICGREKAHASRRVLERPQKAEPYLDDVAAHVLWNYNSIASLLQHMPVCSNVFQAGSRENEDAAAIRHLRFRRHRFDSQAEPLARIVLAFDAVLKAASVISHARKQDDAGKSAALFLEWLDDEKALQLAMLADASDQILTLVRKVDVDSPDPSEHANFIAAFLLEGTIMWLEDKRLPITTSTTTTTTTTTTPTTNNRLTARDHAAGQGPGSEIFVVVVVVMVGVVGWWWWWVGVVGGGVCDGVVVVMGWWL